MSFLPDKYHVFYFHIISTLLHSTTKTLSSHSLFETVSYSKLPEQTFSSTVFIIWLNQSIVMHWIKPNHGIGQYFVIKVH